MVEELEDQLSETRIKKGQLQKAALIRDRIRQVPFGVGAESEVCRRFHGGDEEEEEDGYEVCDGENEKKITRICHVCNKGFSSGKALGGHMRIHGHLYKKRKEDAAYEEEEEEDECCYDDENEEEDVMKKKKRKSFMKNMKMVVPVCSICGKDFQSMKSLYGHMRSHPRNWKGIHPPPPAENPVVSGGAAATTVVDLKKALKCWSVTAKRGRKVSSAGAGDQTSSLSEDTEEEQLRDAAHELMMLAHGESHHEEELDSNSLSYEVVDEHEDRSNWVDLDLPMRKSAPAFSVGKQPQQLRIDGENKKNLRSITGHVMTTKNAVRGKAKAMPENQEAAASGGTRENSSGGEESKKKLIAGYNNRANENTIRKKRMKLIKLKDLGSVHNAAAGDHDNQNPPAAAAEKYKCSRCDKWFPSHQALGGHKSSHNKFKMVIQNSIDEDSNYAAAHHQVPLISSTQTTNSPGELSHTGCGGGSSQPHQILDFDLNEVPQTTEEEENEAAAVDPHYGYVSISLI